MSDESSRSPEQTANDTPAPTHEQTDAAANTEAGTAQPEPGPTAQAAAEPEPAPAPEPGLPPIPAAEPESGTAGREMEPAQDQAMRAEAEQETETEGETQHGGLPKGSIAAVGERLGQRVAQVSEAAGDKVAHAGERVAHAGEAAAHRMAQVGGVAGERVAHAGEVAGQRVILAGEAAEGTVADAQTRAAHAKQRISRQAGELAKRFRHSAPPPVRESGARAVDAVKKHPREAAVGSALVGLVAAIRRHGKRSSGGA